MKEETREALNKVVDIGKKAIHIGWIPFVLYFGITHSAVRPNLLKIISPFAV
jgi:import receptor subunit TOM7